MSNLKLWLTKLFQALAPANKMSAWDEYREYRLTQAEEKSA
jgi:hypothetical protein